MASHCLININVVFLGFVDLVEDAKMKMEQKHPRGRLMLRWRDTVRRDMKAWRIREERGQALTGRNGMASPRPATPHRDRKEK